MQAMKASGCEIAASADPRSDVCRCATIATGFGSASERPSEATSSLTLAPAEDLRSAAAQRTSQELRGSIDHVSQPLDFF